MDKFLNFCSAVAFATAFFAIGIVVGLNHQPHKYVPVLTNQVSLEYALGEHVIVTDYTINKKQELVPGVVTGWGLTDFELTGKEEVHYFVCTDDKHAAHGYKANEITRVPK